MIYNKQSLLQAASILAARGRYTTKAAIQEAIKLEKELDMILSERLDTSPLPPRHPDGYVTDGLLEQDLARR